MHIKEKRNIPPCLKRKKENNYDILSSFGWIGAKALLSLCISSMNFSSFYHWNFYLSSGISLVLCSILFLTPSKTWWWRVNHLNYFILFDGGGGLAILLVSFQVKILNDEIFLFVFSRLLLSGVVSAIFFFFSYHSGNHNTFSFRFISSESTCMMLMPTGTTFHWP